MICSTDWLICSTRLISIWSECLWFLLVVNKLNNWITYVSLILVFPGPHYLYQTWQKLGPNYFHNEQKHGIYFGNYFWVIISWRKKNPNSVYFTLKKLPSKGFILAAKQWKFHVINKLCKGAVFSRIQEHNFVNLWNHSIFSKSTNPIFFAVISYQNLQNMC